MPLKLQSRAQAGIRRSQRLRLQVQVQPQVEAGALGIPGVRLRQASVPVQGGTLYCEGGVGVGAPSETLVEVAAKAAEGEDAVGVPLS